MKTFNQYVIASNKMTKQSNEHQEPTYLRKEVK